VLRPPERDERTGVIAFERLVEASEAVAGAVAEAIGRGERPLVVGGDCSLLVGAAAALRRDGADAGLVFVDGHGDYWDGASSPTGESADMELSILHGGPPPELAGLGGAEPPLIAPKLTAILGHRPADLDPEVAEERARIPGSVAQVDAPAIRERGAAETAREVLAGLGDARRLWLHIDLDALDAEDLPAVSYPLARGLSWEELGELIEPVAADERLVGASVADYNPDLDPGGRYAPRIVEVLGRALT
jgi:arginase